MSKKKPDGNRAVPPALVLEEGTDYQGRIKWFSIEKGFGYISVAGLPEVYVVLRLDRVNDVEIPHLVPNAFFRFTAEVDPEQSIFLAKDPEYVPDVEGILGKS